MEPMEPMAPNTKPPAIAPEPASRPRSRLKAAIAGVAIAGMLTAVGAVSVFAASPQPSSSGAPTASDNGAGGATDHVCPDHANDGSGSGSGSSGSSSSS